MNLKSLSDNALIDQLERIADADRRNIVRCLHYLRELECRRLFSDYKYQSLLDFAVGHLKYSEHEALLRISAMRLMREIPEIDGKITSGILTLTNIAMARTLFAKEKKAGRTYSAEQKRQVIQALEGLSKRQARKLLGEINSDMNKHKELDFDSIDDDLLREKLLRLKGERAHRNPNMTLFELLHELADEALEKRPPRNPKEGSAADAKRKSREEHNHQCSNCGSTFAVEDDHVQPVAAGGDTTYENMRPLCRNCNLRAAIKFYGRKKMDDYLSDVHRPYGNSS